MLNTVLIWECKTRRNCINSMRSSTCRAHMVLGRHTWSLVSEMLKLVFLLPPASLKLPRLDVEATLVLVLYLTRRRVTFPSMSKHKQGWGTSKQNDIE